MMLKINTNFKQGIGWSLAMLAGLGVFSYLTFIPKQTFAAYDWESRKLADISTMQEMNAKICENSAEHESKQLIDARDNKTYWVTKLKDGNCWMTQNLDFDIPSTLDPNTSNVSIAAATAAGVATSNGKVETGIEKSTNIEDWPAENIDNNSTKNYTNLGDYVYMGPDNKHGQDSVNSCQHVRSLADFDTRCSYYTKATLSSNLHYHIGNYYSYSAATVGSADRININGGNATMSICPKGWKLPTSGSNTGEFQDLLIAYGWDPNNLTDSAFNTNIQNATTKGVYVTPLYFVYSGNLAHSELVDAGTSGYYWSSTTNILNTNSNISNAWGLVFTSYVEPRHSRPRYNGLPIRCINDPSILPDSILANNQANISVTVSPVISIDATSSMEGEVDFTTIARGDISATISSNQNYKVLLGTSQSTLEQDPKLTNHNIPMVENDQSIVAGIGKWGVRKLTNSSDIKKESITDEYDRTITQVTVNTADTNITNTTATGITISTSANYSPIGLFAIDSDDNTIKDNSILFYDTGESGISKVIFPVAIAVDAKLPGGKYFTEVVITAVAN